MPLPNVATVLLLFFLYSVDGCPSCEAGSVCYPGIGCVALGRAKDSSVVDCYGVCIDTKLTPTLQCLSAPCPSDPSLSCPYIVENDECRDAPVIPSDGSCVKQGASIKCLSTEEEETLPPPPSNEDKTGLAVFLFVFGVSVLLLLLLIGCRV